jgi:DNA modification methylase
MVTEGHALDVLQTMEPESVHCCVTSPPYWGLRDYGLEPMVWPDGWRGSLGLEPTPELYVQHLVEIFREVRRVLRPDGTLWLNLGDSFAGSWGNYGGQNRGHGKQRRITVGSLPSPAWDGREQERPSGSRKHPTLKPKDLVGIPWRVAFALQADGWYLRSDIIWHKPNPMPESVRDRPTRSHEHVFLLAKSAKYYYDAQAIAEPLQRPDEGKRKTPGRFGGANKWIESQKQSRLHSGRPYVGTGTGTRNRRDVWTIAPKPFRGAHFAVFPPDLIEPCILAGCPEGGVVLDPFSGTGTTGIVAVKNGRRSKGIELNPAYIDISQERAQEHMALLCVRSGLGDG